jgi:hypothetical protein
LAKKLVYNGNEERIIPQLGVFKPGDEVDFSKSLLSTGLFNEKRKKSEAKEGEK